MKHRFEMMMQKEKKRLPELRFAEFEGEWEKKRFSKYIKLYRGSSPRPIHKYQTNNEDGVNWIKIGDTKDVQNYTLKHVSEKITKEGAKRSRPVKKGELILANSMSFGKTYLLDIEGCIYDGWFVLREYEEQFNRSFLLQLLNSELLQRQFKRLSTGGVVQNISSDIVYSSILSKPELKEQQKIAHFLTSIDTRIQHLEKKKTLLEQYKKGVMQKIFKQEIRFKDEEGKEFGKWEKVELKNITSIYDGTHQTPKYVESGVPFYSVEHLTANQFEETKYITEEVFENEKIKLEKGDILMTKIGSIGVSKHIDWDVHASYYVSLALIKEPKNHSSLFLNQYISSAPFQRELWKRTIHVAFPRKINLGEIGLCFVKLPVIQEQTKIAHFLTSLDTKIAVTTDQVEQTKKWKKGLLQRMFV